MKTYLVIEDNNGNVLVHKRDKSIPFLTSKKYHYAYMQEIVDLCKNQLELEVFIKYCVQYNSDIDEAIYVGRLISEIKDEYVYVRKQDINTRLSIIKEDFLGKQEFHKWAMHSWYNDLQNYLDKLFDSYTFSQVKTSSLSTVIKVEAKENYYFKVVPHFFHHELTITDYLSTRYPQNVLKAIKIDLENNFFVTKELKVPLLEESKDISIWKKVLKKYAEVQLNEMEQVDYLLSLGIPNRTMPKLVQHIDEITKEIQSMVLGKGFSLTAREIKEWINRVEQMKEICSKLDRTIPNTIDHGDFYLANIAADSENIIFFDLTDINITHPFVSLTPFFSECDFNKEDKDKLLNTYLECFTEYHDLEELKKIYSLATIVGEIHLAYTYFKLVKRLPQKQKWEIERSFPSCIRHVLKNLKEDYVL